MLICLITLIPILVILKGTESTLLEPVRQCVPTASVRGPCHVCVCSSEGVFHCRLQDCRQHINLESNRPNEDCEPNHVYREDNTFCTCTNDGYWNSENCEEKFKYLQPKITVTHQKLKTNIKCIPNALYLIDCNVCRCASDGLIDVILCTNRYCSQGHKADPCTYGDILRLDHEICSCSDINFYIDRLCINIYNNVVQTLEYEEIVQLIDIGRSWRRLRDLQTDICDTDVVYTVDCNKCVCIDSHLACTTKVCGQNNTKSALRQENPNTNETLPELKSDNDLCEPGRKYRLKCNTCLCSSDGSPSCTTMVCLEDFVLDIKALRGALSTNVTKEQSTPLPEIKYGMKCIYGKTYKMDCNTCRCGHRNSLLCTKVVCLDSINSEIVVLDDKKLKRTADNASKPDDAKDIEKKKKVRKIIRRGNKRILRTDTVGLPPLPPSRICVPGRIYQEDCKKCYCKANRQPVCSLNNACNQPKITRDLIPEDVRPRVRDKEFNYLPALPHSASPCAPGTTYKVDCNVCICDEFQNLICDRLLCISFSEMHKAEALSKSGLPCNNNNYQENEVIQSKCVECACNVTTYCQAKENCISEKETVMRNFGARRNGSRLTFDYTKEKCIPDHIYKDNCNKCYCQKDQTLRCTGKTCLNYSQSLILEKQHEYLQKHGL